MKTKVESPNKARTEWLTPAIVALLTFLTFLPVLANEYVRWDDDRDLIYNPHYKGLGWSNLQWMFSLRSDLKDHYYPLTWLSHAIDYTLWGMDPTGTHLTNLILHTASAVIFFYICRRLLALAMSASYDAKSITISAAFAALLFAVHPLRVESVAWAVERKDCLSGVFFFATVYFYLRSNSDPWARWRWLSAALAAYLLSMLSKSTAVTMPALLIILDVYVLKRLTWSPRQWLTRASGRVLYEKLPFILVAAPLALLSWLGESQVAVESSPLSKRIAQALYAVSFYVWKSIVPLGLAPLYEMPPDFGASRPWVIAAMSGTVAITVLFFLLRSRWPWACWLWTLAVLAPVSGIVQTGGHEAFLAADRYTYLSFLSWAVLGGGLLLHLQSRGQSRREKRRGNVSPLAFRATVTAAVFLSVLGLLTYNQTKVWRNTTTLYTHMLKVDPNASIVHFAYGQFLFDQKDYVRAIPYFRRALSIRPVDETHKNNRGHYIAIQIHGALMNSFAWQDRAEQAKEHWEQALKLLAMCSLTRCLEFEKSLAAALKPERLAEMAKVLAQHGQAERAEVHFKKVTELNPNLPFCVLNNC